MQYGKNMEQFMQGLKDTHIKIIYFDMHAGRWDVTDLKILFVNDHTFYVHSDPKGLWTYAYKPSAISYLFTTEYSRPIDGGHEGVIDIGSVTVGVREHRKTKAVTMVTHITSYVEQGESPLTFDVERTPDCTLPLESPIADASVGASSVSVGAYEAMEELRRAFLGQHRGQYVIQNGSHETLVGGGPQLTDEGIQMIYEIIVQPVTDRYLREGHQFVHAKLFYDTHNHFHANKRHVVFMYDIADHNTCAVFYVEVSTIVEAAKAYAYKKQRTRRKPSQNASRCFEELTGLPTIHLDALWVI